MSRFTKNSSYERAKWFLRRRGLDKLADTPEYVLAMVEYAKDKEKGGQTSASGRVLRFSPETSPQPCEP